MASRRTGEEASCRWFVTATDTGVGKTETSRALLSLLADAGLRPAPFKPYESGCARRSAPADALALKAAARSEDPLERVCPHRFLAPLAPGVAARRAGLRADFRKTQAAFVSFAGRPLVVEGAGGLFVPLDARRDVIDLIARWRLPVVLVARAGLGTLNHVALSVEALRRRRLSVATILLSQATAVADPSVEDNAAHLRRRHRLLVLGPVPFEPDPARRHQRFREVLRPWVQRQLEEAG